MTNRDIRSRLGTRFLLALAVLVCGFAYAVPALAQTVVYDLSTTSAMRINLPMSQAVTVAVSSAVGKVVSADVTIADAQQITDKSIYIVGKAFGTTTVNLFSAAGEPVGLLAVEVGADTKDMSGSIHAAVPSSKVKVNSVNGRVRLSGTVTDAESLKKVLDVVAEYGNAPIINTITISGGQQVNLEVRILEAQRDAGRELGIAWGGSVGGVSTTIGGGPNNPAAGAKSFSSFITSVISSATGVSLSAMLVHTWS